MQLRTIQEGVLMLKPGLDNVAGIDGWINITDRANHIAARKIGRQWVRVCARQDFPAQSGPPSEHRAIWIGKADVLVSHSIPTGVNKFSRDRDCSSWRNRMIRQVPVHMNA